MLIVRELKQRTIKLILAIMKEIPIVSEKWVFESAKDNSKIYEFEEFPPEDAEFE